MVTALVALTAGLFGLALGWGLLRSRTSRTPREPPLSIALGEPLEGPAATRTGGLIGGRYRLGEGLAWDELGVMFHAQDESMGLPVRVYLLRAEPSGSPLERERVREQARAWLHKNDPNTRVIDVVTDQSDTYLVLATPG